MSIDDITNNEPHKKDSDSLSQRLISYSMKPINYFKNKDTRDKYLSATTAAWAFYTPIMGAIELGVGLFSKYVVNYDKPFRDIALAVVSNRIISAGVHALAFRPVRKLREYWTDKYHLTKDSPTIDKVKVAVGSITVTQLPLYTGIVLGTGAITGFFNPIDAGIKIGLVLAAGALTATHYHKFADMWGHKYFNQQSLLYDSKENLSFKDMIKNTFSRKSSTSHAA